MFKVRVIPCLDVKDGRVVKGVNFVNLRDAGDPVQASMAYDAAGADELAVGDGGRVDRRLVGAGEQQLTDVIERSHAAADRQGHEADLGGAADDVDDRAAVLVARRDVEEAQFVGPRLVVGDGALNWIAGVAQVDELDALDDAAVLDVEARNDARFQHDSAAHRTRLPSSPATRGGTRAASLLMRFS